MSLRGGRQIIGGYCGNDLVTLGQPRKGRMME